MKLSIRQKLFLGIVPLCLIVYALVVFFQTRGATRTAIENVKVLLRETTSKYAAECDVVLTRAAQATETAADVMTVAPQTETDEINALFRRILEANTDAVGFGLGFEPNKRTPGVRLFDPYVYRDNEKKDEIGANPIGEFDYFVRDWYADVKKTGRALWTEPYVGSVGNTSTMCTYSVPFFHHPSEGPSELLGVVAIDVSLDNLRGILARFHGNRIALRLVSVKGTIIADSDPALEMKETLSSLAEKSKNPSLIEITKQMMSGNQGTVSYQPDSGQERIWLAYAPLPRTGWKLIASLPESQVLTPIYRQAYQSIALFFIGLFLIVGIISIVSFRITAPLKRLTTFAGKLAKGDFDATIDGEVGSDEIGDLARTFETMTAELKRNVKRLIDEESARKVVEKELQFARRIQASLLPRIFPPFPEMKEFNLHAMNEPATFMAGDFFDFFFIDQTTLVVVLADVSGKGVPAAMFMAVSRTAIRNYTVPGRSVEEIIESVNRTLASDNVDMMFVTCFYGQYDIRTGRLTYVNAGHNPPYIMRQTGGFETLGATGTFLGPFPDLPFSAKEVVLAPGDLLVTFTDGVTEAYDKTPDDLYGETRLETLLEKIRDEPVEDICDIVFEDAIEFSHGERHDDITLLVLRRNI